MKNYRSPEVELVHFDNQVLSQQTSGTCRCYLDNGIKNDYNAAGSGCWTDSEDASGYEVHDAPLA